MLLFLHKMCKLCCWLPKNFPQNNFLCGVIKNVSCTFQVNIRTLLTNKHSCKMFCWKRKWHLWYAMPFWCSNILSFSTQMLKIFHTKTPLVAREQSCVERINLSVFCFKIPLKSRLGAFSSKVSSLTSLFW